jgi:DNA (cytosine-5)-methyltransferase 1
MRYLSVCSGVEAATVAWHGLGWQPVAFSEIEKFPSQVLAHHYPDVPNLGDMTKYKEWDFGTNGLDLLVGGTPCQSFSVAGLRKGLEDPRGNLALVYCGILDKFRPKWFVWENVPGVLSSGKGRDFGSFLGALAELGYGWSYRVLDAQHFGVPQRRRRVFVVGHLGDWRPAAKVLFESESLRRDTKTSRKTRETTASSSAPSIANCLQTTCNDYSRADGFNMICTDIVGPLTARDHKGIGSDDCNPTMAKMVAYESRVTHVADKCPTITSSASGYSRAGNAVTEHETYIAYALQGSGSTSQNANGSGYKEEQSFTLNRTDVHGVAYAFEPGLAKRDGNPNRFVEEMSPTLRANMGDNQIATAHAFKMRYGKEGGGKGYLGSDELAFTLSTQQDQQVAVGVDTYNGTIQGDIAATMTADMAGPTHSGPKVMQDMAVRRLTPVECERLQGFPDNYTNIRENCPDGPRYKAMGNSMAVPVMRWIGERIKMVEDSQ